MTVIACTLNYKDSYPVFIGDLLITSINGKHTNAIPTHNSGTTTDLSEDQLYKPDGLSQKVYIIRENVCISLAGVESELKNFLEDFRIYCNALNVITIEKMAYFLNNYDIANTLSKSAFLIAISEKGSVNWINSEMFYHPYEGSWKIFNTDYFGTSFVCGSGEQKYSDLLRNWPMSIRDEEMDPLNKAITRNLTNFAHFLALERYHAAFTVSEFWGAGFEMVFWNGSFFEKLQDFAFIIYNAEYDEYSDIGNPDPNLILYYKYLGEELVITAIEIKKFEKFEDNVSTTIVSKMNDYTCYAYTVPGIENKSASVSYNASDLSFSTNLLVIGYTMKAKDRIGVIPQISFNNPDAGLRFQMKGNLEYKMTKKILDGLKDNANRSYSKQQDK